MGYEISQFDIPDRQLLGGDPQSKTARASDIGEAKVTRTFFGSARVKVIRAQDRKRRAWLLTALLAIAAAIAAWQGWMIVQRVENEPPPVPLSERIWVSPPTFRPAHIAPDPHPSSRTPESLIQSEIDSLLSGPLPRHPPAALKGTAKAPEKPADSETDLPAPAATAKSTAANDTAVQQPAGQAQQPAGQKPDPSVTIRPETKIVSTTPKPAANQQSPLAEPAVGGNAAAPLPTDNGQPAPAKAQE